MITSVASFRRRKNLFFFQNKAKILCKFKYITYSFTLIYDCRHIVKKVVLVARLLLYYVGLTTDISLSRANTAKSDVLQSIKQSSMKKGMFFSCKV